MIFRVKHGILFVVLVALFPFPCSGGEAILSLGKAVEIALKQNPTLQAAKLTFSMARQAEREAWTKYFPAIKFGYNYTRWNEEQHVRLQPVTIPPLAPGQEAVTIKPGNVITSKQNVYQYTFSFQQPVFTGWAITAAHKMALLEADQAELEAAETCLEVAYNVKRAYFAILKAERRVEVARLAVKQLSKHLYVAQNFFDQGIIPRNDLLKSQVALANAKQDMTRAENGLEVAKATLNSILHRDVNAALTVEEVFILPAPALSLNDAVAEAMERRPVVLAVRKGVDKAHEGVRLARSGYFPQVFLEGVYRKHGNTPDCTGDDLTDPEDWRITASLEWTLFEMGRTRHQVEKARLGELRALALLEEVRDQVALEVKEAYLDMETASRNIETAKSAVEQAKENFKVTEERYREQIDTSTEVLDAQTLLTQAQTYYYRAVYQYDVAVARLFRVLGRNLDKG
jgi:outer membrane protein TolC